MLAIAAVQSPRSFQYQVKLVYLLLFSKHFKNNLTWSDFVTNQRTSVLLLLPKANTWRNIYHNHQPGWSPGQDECRQVGQACRESCPPTDPVLSGPATPIVLQVSEVKAFEDGDGNYDSLDLQIYFCHTS